jgi:GNAT superfamily N-acetyltransferase
VANIRRARADKWREVRELRLEALESEPTAFRTTFDEAAARSDEMWKHSTSNWWVAEQDGVLIGMAAWFIRDDGLAILIGMYVQPRARGQGIGAELVREVCDDARDHNHRRIGLAVTEGSAARRFYESCGFIATGKRFPLREGSSIFAESMGRDL